MENHIATTTTSISFPQFQNIFAKPAAAAVANCTRSNFPHGKYSATCKPNERGEKSHKIIIKRVCTQSRKNG